MAYVPSEAAGFAVCLVRVRTISVPSRGEALGHGSARS